MIDILISFFADRVLGATLYGLKRLWQGGPTDKSIESVEQEFRGQYESLGDTFRAWLARDRVKESVLALASAETPDRTLAKSLVDDFLEAGFDSPGDARTEAGVIIARFFTVYLEQLIVSEEGQVVQTHVLQATLGRLTEAAGLYEELAQHDPARALWRLERAVIARRQEQPDDVRRFLPQPEETAALPIGHVRRAIGLQLELEDAHGALETAYVFYRTHPTDADAHLNYVGTFFRVSPALDAVLHREDIGFGDAVTLDVAGSVQHHEILDASEPTRSANEHHPDSTLGRLLLGSGR